MVPGTLYSGNEDFLCRNPLTLCRLQNKNMVSKPVQLLHNKSQKLFVYLAGFVWFVTGVPVTVHCRQRKNFQNRPRILQSSNADVKLSMVRGGEVAQSVELQGDTSLTLVRFPGWQGICCPRVNFRRKLSYDVRTPPCAIV